MLPRSVWTENFVSVFEVRTYLSIYYFGLESRGFIFLMLSWKVGFSSAVWARKRELCLQRYVWVETQLINCGVTKMLYSKTEGSNQTLHLLIQTTLTTLYLSLSSPFIPSLLLVHKTIPTYVVVRPQRYIVRRKTEKPWLPDQGLDQ